MPYWDIFSLIISSQLGVQSHHLFTVVAFKAIVLVLQFGIQSHWLVWRSELSFTVFRSSEPHSSVWRLELAFRVVVHSLAFRAIGQLGIQSCHILQFDIKSIISLV